MALFYGLKKILHGSNFPISLGDFPISLGDFPISLGDFPISLGDCLLCRLPIVVRALIRFVFLLDFQ